MTMFFRSALLLPDYTSGTLKNYIGIRYNHSEMSPARKEVSAMIRFAICDDSEIQSDIVRTVILDYLSDKTCQNEISVFGSGNELLKDVRTGSGYDFYILDIIMPGMDGLELAAALREMNDRGRIIFLTSSLEYAVRAYDVRASFYMLKPIDIRKFSHILDELIAEVLREKASLEEIRTVNGTVLLNPSDIVTVCAENRIPVYYLRDGRIVTGITMRRRFRDEVASLLSLGFFAECGVSRIINLFCVEYMDSSSIRLCDGSVVYPPAGAKRTLLESWRDRGRKV